jgi:hypothetical protein
MLHGPNPESVIISPRKTTYIDPLLLCDVDGRGGWCAATRLLLTRNQVGRCFHGSFWLYNARTVIIDLLYLTRCCSGNLVMRQAPVRETSRSGGTMTFLPTRLTT